MITDETIFKDFFQWKEIYNADTGYKIAAFEIGNYKLIHDRNYFKILLNSKVIIERNEYGSWELCKRECELLFYNIIKEGYEIYWRQYNYFKSHNMVEFLKELRECQIEHNTEKKLSEEEIQEIVEEE